MSRHEPGHLQESNGHNRRPAAAALRFLPVAVCLLGAIGCADSDRKRIEGTVTLEGEPLKEGQIGLFPQPGTKGPSAGAPIVDGKFTIDATKGPMSGTFSVQITASRFTGRKISLPPPDEGTIDEIEQYLPARYNTDSELKVDITENGPNRFEFTLSGQQER